MPAPEGQVWVCGACGKTSRTRYGFDATNVRVASPGWDESCMLNAVLCYERTTQDLLMNKPYEAVNKPEDNILQPTAEERNLLKV